MPETPLPYEHQAQLYAVEHPPIIGDTYTSADVELAWLSGKVAGLTAAENILGARVAREAAEA